MRYIAASLLTFFLSLGVYGQVDTSKSHFWMMTYFISGSDYDGARLAFSSDTTGAHWQKYNSEAAILVPTKVTGANDSRMRDPMISFDSVNRRFNMVWTVSWTGTVIGWDTSSLLKTGTWGSQVGLAVGANITNCSFSWAPEIFWDDIKSQWMLYWSVSISGSTTRVYYSMIPDNNNFSNFSTPEVLLNPGYDIIDADIIKVGTGNYQMFFKDERTGYKNICRASGATTPQGTYSVNSVIAAATTEGPTVFKAGGQYCVIVDHYTKNGLGIVRANNIDTTASPWPGDASRMVYNGTGSTFMYVSHCNIIEVPKMLVKWMLYNDSAWVKFVNTTVDLKDLEYIPSTNNSNLFDVDTRVFDVAGRTVGKPYYNRASSKFDAGHLPAGVYLQWNKKDIATKKVSTKK